MYSIDTYIYTHIHTNLLLKVSHPGIFPSTFLQPVNGSESYETPQSLHAFFFSLILKQSSKIFHSIHLFFLLFGLDSFKQA